MKRLVLLSMFLLGCGAKTGLEIPDSSPPEMDAALPRDAGHDAGPDAGHDAGIDAPFCPDIPVALSRTDVETIFVIDGSGSMGLTWDGLPWGGGLPSRWMIVRDTLASVLPTFDRQLAMGAKVFPNGVDCQVNPGLDVTPQLGAVDDILALFDRWRPEGATPTAMALRSTIDVPARAPRVIIATMDGGPNCNDDTGVPPEECVCTSARRACLAPPPDGPRTCLDATRTIDVVRESYEVFGVPVVVVGIDDPSRPDLSDFLDRMAIAGGWPRPEGSPRRFFIAREPEDLEVAFGEIAELISRCVLIPETPPPEDATVVVRVDGEILPQDLAHLEGWDWIDRSLGAIAFFGSSCDALRTRDVDITADILCAD